jgi:plastocyanin
MTAAISQRQAVTRPSFHELLSFSIGLPSRRNYDRFFLPIVARHPEALSQRMVLRQTPAACIHAKKGPLMRAPARGTPLTALAALLLVPGVLLLAACGSNNNKKAAAVTVASGTVAPLSSSGSATTATTVAVEIKNIAFPDTISVKPGTTVTWTNKDSFPHTVTADSGQPVSFDSKSIAAGGTFSTTFAKAGTYSYHCEIHSTMHGKIVVSDQASGVTTPAAAPTGAADPYKY